MTKSDPLEVMTATYRAMEAHRGLRNKERTVEAMRADRDRRLHQPTLPQNLAQQAEWRLAQLERGGEGKTVTDASELARLLAEQQGANRARVFDVDPPASALGRLRQAAALLPEPGYEPVFVDGDALPPRAPELTPQETEELLRRLTTDNPR